MRIQRVDHAQFDQWDALHALLAQSFSYMDGRIDPPSSMSRLTPYLLKEKAAHEDLFIAIKNDEVIACIFGAAREEVYYVGKFSIADTARGTGLARRLLALCEGRARDLGFSVLELQTRIELVENHRAFRALGFVETSRTAHEGYSSPTSLTYQRQIP